MSFEQIRIDKWLRTLLTGDATLTGLVADRVFSEVAPEGTATPFIVFQAQSDSVDALGVGQARIMSASVYMVKAVTSGSSYAPLIPIADRIDELLHRASGSADGASILASTRERTLRLHEHQDGVEWRTLASSFRIIVQ